MVDVAKYSIGRLRPNFMDTCRPTVGYLNCTINQNYIEHFECTKGTPNEIKESRLSFYSGHSAFSFYATWYTSVSFFILLLN